MDSCWADSLRARVNMQEVLLGGGGGRMIEAVEPREQGVRSFEESGVWTSIRNTETKVCAENQVEGGER